MNRKKLETKFGKAVVAIAVALALVLPGSAVIANIDNGESNPSEPLDVANWPMFHHDLENSGYSTSKAPDTNHTLWEYPAGTMYSSPAVVDGKVFFGHKDASYNGFLYCLDTDGNKLWDYPAGSDVRSSPAVADGKVYFGSYDKKVYCLDTDGNELWNYTTGNRIRGSPTVADGKVYIGSTDYKIYCLNALTGAWIWEYAAGHFVVSTPAVVDGKVYFGSYDAKVYCLNASTGAWIWEYATGNWVDSSPAVVDGKVYVGSFDEKVYCLNALTGAWIWEYATGGEVESSPAVVDGKVYIGSGQDGKVYCLNASTGAWIWEYATSGYMKSSPAVADGKVFTGCSDDYFYCLNASNGNKLWDYFTAGISRDSPAVADGKVFFGSRNKIHCFGPEVSTTPPQITDVTATPPTQVPGGYVNITATVTDVDGVDTVKVNITYPDSSTVNVTMNEGSYYYNTVYTEIGTYNYFIWANDTIGNDATSSTYQFEIMSLTEPPEITDVTATPPVQVPGGYVNISATVTDNIGVDTVKVNITYPNDSTVNVTMNEGSYHYNATYTEIGTYDYFIWANDTDGNNATSDVYHFVISEDDIIPPVISDVIMATSDPLDTIIGWENVTCNVTDNVLVNQVKLNVTNPNTTTVEYTMTKVPGTDTYYCNTTLTQPGNYSYYIWADDFSGNDATSSPEQFALPMNEDVDMNGQAYFEDLVAIVMMYGDTGTNGWVREDVDNNGEVYFDDLVRVVMEYGEWWWT